MKNVPNIILPNQAVKSDYRHVWHQYTIRVHETNFGTTGAPMRQQVIDELAKRGIGSMCYYPVPLHLQEAFKNYGYKQGDFPITERLAGEVLSLPMFPELSDREIQAVGQAISEIMTEQVAVQPIVVPTPPVAI